MEVIALDQHLLHHPRKQAISAADQNVPAEIFFHFSTSSTARPANRKGIEQWAQMGIVQV
jgi:hypothetical protein